MNTRRSFWLAVLAYLAPTFPLGYFWHLATFHDAYQRLEMYRDQVIIPMGLGSMLIQAVFLAWSYPRLFSTERTAWIGSAVRFFVVFSLLSWSFTTLPVAAKYRMTSVSDFMMLETGFTFLQFALVAPLIALAYRNVTVRTHKDAYAT
jgi:hypothetical protein